MINFNDIHSLITLESLEVKAPAAFNELLTMELEQRKLLLAWLNCLSSSPIGRGYADIEIDKEDAISSSLKTRYFIEFESERVSGNYVKHFMSYQQIFDFFNDRDSQRKRVQSSVYALRRISKDKAYLRDIKERGEGWAYNRVKLLAERLKASNDCEKEKPHKD
jgi:hypothetical protein